MVHGPTSSSPVHDWICNLIGKKLETTRKNFRDRVTLRDQQLPRVRNALVSVAQLKDTSRNRSTTRLSVEQRTFV